MKIKGIIYRMRNLVNGKLYVGQTAHALEVRIADHARHGRQAIGNAIRKYGIQSFEVKIIDTATSRAILHQKEIYWIKRLKSRTHQNGYNITCGGDGVTGHRHSEATKKRLAEAARHHVISPEGRERIRQANSGKLHPALTALNRSRTGIPLSPQHRAKVGRAGELHVNFGKHHSAETRARISKATTGRAGWNKGLKMDRPPWMKGRKHSPESLELMRTAALAREARKRLHLVKSA